MIKPHNDKQGDKPAKPAPKPKRKAGTAKPPAINHPETGTVAVNASSTKTQATPPAMEVHHHPQLEHKPKPFKEYLLEGFMIFVAVMMGFIAENIRETIDNNEHVKQLTSQLVHDLKADTAQLNFVYTGEKKIAGYNDTLFKLLQQPLAKINKSQLQAAAVNSHGLYPFHSSEGAILAIKNELHLKQFSNSKIISYFDEYEGDKELLHTAQDIYLQYQHTYLDSFLTQHFTPANLDNAFAHTIMPTNQMRNLTQADLDQLATNLVLMRVITDEILRHNRELHKHANDMLKYVVKQYGPGE